MTLVSLRRNVLTGARGDTAQEGTLARSYKLRLSDGTILAVDLEGLTVWLMDKRAMVQVAGAKEWRPLKEVIAEARVAAKYAAREQAEARPKKKRKKRGGRDALPLVPPPSAPGEKPPAPDAPVVENISSEDAMIGVPQDIQTLADDPAGPSAASPVADPPVIRLKPLDGEAPRGRSRVDEPIGVADEPVGVADEPIGVADEPIGVADEPIGVADEPIGVADEPPGVADDPRAVADEAGGFGGDVDSGAPEVESAGDGSLAVPAVLPEDAESSFIDPSASGPFAGAFIDEEPDTRPPEPAPVVPPIPEPAVPEPAVPEPTAAAEELPPPPSDDDVSRLLDSLESARVDDALLGAPPDIAALAGDPPPPVVAEPADPPPAILPGPEAAPLVAEPPVDVPPAPPESPARVRVVVRDPVTRTVPAPGADILPPLAPVDPPLAAGSPQVLADEVVVPSGARSGPVSTPADRLPVIPMKPRDDEILPSPEGGTGGPGGLGAMLLAAVGAVGALFSRLLNPISRLERGEPLVDDSAPPVLGPSLEKLRTTASGWAGGVRESAAQIAARARVSRSDTSDSETGRPPVDEEAPSRLASTLQAVTSSISSAIGTLTERIRGLAPSRRDEEPSSPGLDPAPYSTAAREDEESAISPVSLKVEPLADSIEADEGPSSDPPRWESPPVVFEPATPPPAGDQPRLTAPPPAEPPEHLPITPAPVTPPTSTRGSSPPPPSTGQLDVVPFVERIEPREEEDVYEGDGAGGFLGAAWAWTKSLLLLGAAAAIVAFAVVNWRTWFPTAAELGEATFTEVDRVAKAGERAEQLQQAVDAAVPELPHLGPETIRLVLLSNPTGLPAASEAFRIAGDAVDRGLGTLTVAEANELEGLRGQLRDGLGPLEREQLEGYAQTRARRIVYPAEHAHALALVARGTQTLSAESRRRLQTLLGKAIAAGIGPPALPPTMPLPRRAPGTE